MPDNRTSGSLPVETMIAMACKALHDDELLALAFALLCDPTPPQHGLAAQAYRKVEHTVFVPFVALTPDGTINPTLIEALTYVASCRIPLPEASDVR